MNGNEHDPSALAEAASLLASIGASVCHPTSNEYSPAVPHCNDIPSFLEEEDERFLHAVGVQEDWFYIKNGLLAALCVTTAAIAAGLTMGLMSLDPLMLTIKMRAASSETERKQAAALLPVVQQHHLLLVTLLLLNAMANEALPLFLDNLVPSYLAIIFSVTLVLFFGEIIPSALCTGPSQMSLASRLIPLVKTVMCLLLPLAWPIAKMLDCLLHDDEELGSMYSRGELTALVRIQYEERMASKRRHREERAMFQEGKPKVSKATVKTAKREFEQQTSHSVITTAPSADSHSNRSNYQRSPSIHLDEVSMVTGALSMKTKVAIDVYTSLRKLYAVPYDTILDEPTVVRIYSSGYSRVPVYERNPNKPKDFTAIRGVLMTRQLIVIDSSDNRPISTLPLSIPFCVSPKKNLVDLINMFQTGEIGHLCLVCARPNVGNEALESGKALPPSAGLMGVVTLEDVLEMLLQEQILDETDKLERDEIRLAKWAAARWKQFVSQKKAEHEDAAMLHDTEDLKMADIVHQAMDQAKQGATDETPLLESSDADEKKHVSFLPFLK